LYIAKERERRGTRPFFLTLDSIALFRNFLSSYLPLKPTFISPLILNNNQPTLSFKYTTLVTSMYSTFVFFHFYFYHFIHFYNNFGFVLREGETELCYSFALLQNLAFPVDKCLASKSSNFLISSAQSPKQGTTFSRHLYASTLPLQLQLRLQLHK